MPIQSVIVRATYTDKRAVARWVFQGEPGYPPHQNTVGYWWRLTQKHAGLTGSGFTTCAISTPQA